MTHNSVVMQVVLLLWERTGGDVTAGGAEMEAGSVEMMAASRVQEEGSLPDDCRLSGG